jgi:hypothetical protein
MYILRLQLIKCGVHEQCLAHVLLLSAVLLSALLRRCVEGEGDTLRVTQKASRYAVCPTVIRCACWLWFKYHGKPYTA